MDPALWEILKQEDGSEKEIEAIIRLDSPEAKIPGVRIIARFGMIATCRLKKRTILPAHGDDRVVSLKAPRAIGPEWEPESKGGYPPRGIIRSDTRRPPLLSATGKNVVIACLDWGLDFNNDSFKHRDGSTRLIALWDQRGAPVDRSNKYGYGTMHFRNHINEALKAEDPYETLGYHPADADRGSGAHGTHVLDIAAGNGMGGGVAGVAPEADLIFVHLANRNTGGLANLGDSVRILEALDFVVSIAGARPWVVNLSVGRHGGPHNGTTLCEIAFDAVLQAATNRFIVQSAGNYLDKRIHASGTLREGQEHTLQFNVNANDSTTNELEIWTRDELSIVLQSPAGKQSLRARPGSQVDISDHGIVVGRIYNRKLDPNNGDNHIDIFLYPEASAGLWKVMIQMEKRVDGIFHAWLERDDGCALCQTRFVASDANPHCTTGTLANGHLPLVVGAYDGHSVYRHAARFSSVGPTRDGRSKPDLVAPGVAVLAARSAGRRTRKKAALIRKSGTSMAAPHVTGTVALCLQVAGRPITSSEIRRLIIASTDKADGTIRYGHGYLNISRAVNAAAQGGAGSVSPRRVPLKKTNIRYMQDADTLERLIGRIPKGLQSGKDLMKEILRSANFDLFAVDPERLYRAFVSSGKSAGTEEAMANFVVVGKPGESLNAAPEGGDILIRIAPGEPGLGHVCILSGSALLSPAHFEEESVLTAESRQPGMYALVIEAGPFPRTRQARFARRLLGEDKKMLDNQILLRVQARSGCHDHDCEGQLIDEESYREGDHDLAAEVAPANLVAITHAGAYPMAYDRLTKLGVIEPLPARSKRKFRGTPALQSALNAWAPYLEKIMKPPVYILTAGLYVDKPGEHGNGNAVDIDGFWWSDSEVYLAIDAPKDWLQYLTIEATLRKVFGTVLNYDYNAAHRDHWHCDLGGSKNWRAVRSQALFAQRALNVIWGETLSVDGKWGPASKAASLRQGYDLSSAGAWDRFLDNIIVKESTPA